MIRWWQPLLLSRPPSTLTSSLLRSPPSTSAWRFWAMEKKEASTLQRTWRTEAAASTGPRRAHVGPGGAVEGGALPLLQAAATGALEVAVPNKRISNVNCTGIIPSARSVSSIIEEALVHAGI